MRAYIYVILFISAVISETHVHAQLFGGRGLGGNLGITTCTARTNPSANIPASFDAREQWSDCIQPIRDQGSCGRFKSNHKTKFGIRKIESIIMKLYNSDDTCKGLVVKSCQAGCSGGYLDVAMNYLVDTGIVGETCYPYVGSETTCGVSQCLNGTSSNNQKFRNKNCYKLDGISNIQYDIMTYGPIVAGFTVYKDFFDFKSGVYVKNSDESAGGHAVKIIGWGTENGVDYWLAANSWSSKWGDNGYFKIRRGTNECSIEDNMVGGEADTASVSDQFEEYPVLEATSPSASPAASMSPSSSPLGKSGSSLGRSALAVLQMWSLLCVSALLLVL